MKTIERKSAGILHKALVTIISKKTHLRMYFPSGYSLAAEQ
jgi:hypothetical protein